MAIRYLTEGPDVFHGGPGKDVVYALGGDDTVFGYAGNDELHGGHFDDDIMGGNGNDFIYGDAGWDKLLGGAGDDHIWGGTGDDSIDPGGGNDVVKGGSGNDSISDRYDRGGGGNDKLSGGAGDDSITSEDTGHDILRGEAGSDTLSITGSDVAYGGSGDDFLFAGALSLPSPELELRGQLIGGSGQDVFGVSFAPNQRHDVADIKDFNANDYFTDISWRTSDGQVYTVVMHGSDLGPAQTGTISGDVDKVQLTSNGHDLVFSFNENDQVIVRGGADWLHVS